MVLLHSQNATRGQELHKVLCAVEMYNLPCTQLAMSGYKFLEAVMKFLLLLYM